MSKFKIGDRVRVFGKEARHEFDGVVAFCSMSGIDLLIQPDDCSVHDEGDQPGSTLGAHPKQCRRLIKKKDKGGGLEGRIVAWIKKLGFKDFIFIAKNPNGMVTHLSELGVMDVLGLLELTKIKMVYIQTKYWNDEDKQDAK